MKTLKELLDYVIQQHKNGTDCKVLGEGTYSVVWDFGNSAYKLTNELSYTRAVDMQKKCNALHQQGVNVPKINKIDRFETTTNSVVLNLKSFLNYYSGEDFFNILADFSNSFKDNQGKYGFVGIDQQKIIGTSCFSQLEREHIKLADNISKRVKKLPDFLLKNLETQLKTNVDFFINIPTDYYQKFIEDGAQIISSGLTIDNQLRTNFIYTNEGFYYIDLDGLNDTRALSPVENIFEATIDNICMFVYTEASGYNSDLAKQQLDLCTKLVKSIKASCKNAQIEQMYNEYNSKPNMLKMLYNNAINNVDEVTAIQYKLQIQHMLKQDQIAQQRNA